MLRIPSFFDYSLFLRQFLAMLPNLKLVDLKLPKEGFREFISAWILESDNKIYIIDPGPTKSLPQLIDKLDGKKPDYILLTHIHVDHAGGVGSLSTIFPEAKIIASQISYKHLIDPSKLIQASIKNLGNLMELYGEIKPVLEKNICKLIPAEIEIIETPGHAAHHITFVIDNLVFCGEALGVRHSGSYLRPASPIKFDLNAYKQSITNLKHLTTQTLCFGHYGSIQADTKIYDIALNQIELWVEIISSFNPKTNVLTDELEQKIFSALISRDSLLEQFNKLDSDIKNREKIFIGNSIKGIWHYLSSLETPQQ